jgi:hypothetical protein
MNERKLSKTSIIIIIIIALTSVVVYFGMQGLKEAKVKELLIKLGYENIKSVTVFNIRKIKDMNTTKIGKQYSCRFDTSTQKCKGFIFLLNKDRIEKDIECKKL